ncbi:MAG: hypothetical protein WD317_07950 [Balneolaceae bacterium]
MYITEPAEQNRLIQDMTQLRKDMDAFEVYYHHPYTNRMWKSFFPRSTEKELGPKLLRHEPLPENLKKLISVCLVENVPQNAKGLGIELSVLVPEWPAVFDILEECYPEYHSGQVRLFLKHLHLETSHRLYQRETDSEGIPGKELKKIIWRMRKLKLKSFLF